MYLSDLMGTKYFPLHFNKDLDYVFQALAMGYDSIHVYNEGYQEIKKDPTRTIDIKGCHFQPSTMSCIQDAVKNGIIRAIDTGNSVRNDMLLKTLENSRNDYIAVPLPEIHDFDKDIVETLSGLDPDVVYCPNNQKNIQLPYLLTVLFYKPEIKLDPGTYVKKMFKYIRGNIDMEERTQEDYWYITGNTYFTAHFDSDGMTYIPSLGRIDYEQFAASTVCIPAPTRDDVGYKSADFHRLRCKCLKDLKEKLESKLSFRDIIEMG